VPGLDSKVEAAIMRALSKKPSQRFASARAFSDALGASAMRLDAPKILHNDTRLIETPTDPILIAPPRRSVVERLPNIPGLSPELRAVVYGGGIAALAALAGVGVFFYRSAPPPAPPATFQTASVPVTAVNAPIPKLQTPPAAVAPPNPGDTATLTGPIADIVAAANRGDPAAQNTLGVKYVQGEDGLPRDDVKAVEWYRKAANQNFAKAEVNLGDMYFYGRGGLLQSYLDALSWYLKAAQQDAPDAQYRLGFMYERGTGTSKDTAKAVQLFRSAAEHGYAVAQNLMGTLYATGDDGVAKDDKQALDWFQKAASQGYAKAQKNLGDMYFFGHGVDKDYAQALAWYTKAADQKFADAQFRLGFMYEKGLGVDQNNQLAIDQYTKAVRNGSVEAQRALDRLASVK
jgi:TPR repeat protein